MQLPRWMIWVIDPVTAYMQDRSPGSARPMFRGGAIFGPGVEGGARQATPAELEEMRAQAHAARRSDVGRGEPSIHPMAEAAARQLIDHGSVTVRSGEREVRGRIVTFWRGDSLLSISVHEHGMSSSSMARVPRNFSQHLSLLACYLSDALHPE